MNCSDVLPPRRRPVVDERPEEETVEAWCVEYATTRDPQLRARIVKELEWLVRHCARQMVRRDEPFDDLVQVSFLGLIKALDRFDPSFDVRFRTFASVTILGELRRHYRGTWRVRVPRSLQD